ncbi:BTAD domain-containing putative transcriptional regulator [Streptomyces sp. NPDC002870]|uniref:AfsR/SARP family transcriptional regulator n=1 Tax=Streptomyces sp. NPDC002870 TaxID=3364666 RepID=UPI00369100C1
MRFGLLGPPAVHDASGDPRPLNSAKARALLAALLLRPNRVVPVDELKAALWGDEPPASAHASLHNHVTRLRRLLAEDDRLRAAPPGYLLRVEPGELDTEVFEAQVRTARAAYARGDWAAVAEAARLGLALWRGSPLAGLYEPGEGAPALVERLRESRLLMLEWHYDAELQLGRHDGVGPELAALVAEFPLREAFHRQLMLILHRTGRQAEALAAYQSLRRTLVEELGVDPGPAVQEVYQEVLRRPQAARPAAHSVPAGAAHPVSAGAAHPVSAGAAHPAPAAHPVPAPAAHPAQAAAESRPPPRPAQLPPAPAHFTGREDLAAELRAALALAAADDGVSRPVVVSGMAGVGKSALAVRVAHALRDDFPDGQLYVNLRGATPGATPLDPGNALCALLRDLGVDPLQVPGEVDAAAALLRSTLAPTRTLLVLDDAASAAQVRPLLPAGPGCAVVVTSRSPLTALDGAARFPLAPLSAADSGMLLRAVSGRGFDEGLDRLVERCGRLPLALRVVAARLAARRALTADVLAGLLDAQTGRLDQLDYDDLSVRGSLAVAHDGLDPDAALALRRLGAVDLPEYGAPAVARLMDTAERRAAAALDRLVDVALLEEVSYGRFVPHDLVRDFARELAERDDGRQQAAERVLVWYAEATRQTGIALLPPGQEAGLRLPGPIGEAAPFDSAEQALAWGDLELPNLLALTERYVSQSATALLLVRAGFTYLQRRGRLQELAVLGELALDAARKSGDTAAEAHALTDLAGMNFLSGRTERALILNESAVTIWRTLGDDRRIQRGLGNRGMLLEGLGRYEEAADALESAIAYARRLGDAHGEAIILSHLGNLYEHTDARAAIVCHERSLTAGVRLNSEILRLTAHCNIGYAHLTLGEPAEAARHFDESLALIGDDGDWHTQSQARIGRVRALRELGRAEDAHRECALLLERAGSRADTQMQALARHQRGLLVHAEGGEDEARDLWESALGALEALDGKHVALMGELRELLGRSATL